MKLNLISVAVCAAFLFPTLSQAESNINTPTPANGTASARLDFRVTIPRILFLQVGTGTPFVNALNGTNLNLIDFVVTPANLGGGPITATPTSGDLGAGAVTVRVFGNDGAIGLTSTTTGNLTNAAGDTIPWTEIAVAPAAGTASGVFQSVSIPHPTFVSGLTSPPVSLTATAKVVRSAGTWTYTFANSAPYAAGTYGGVGVLNGRVTYTATLP